MKHYVVVPSRYWRFCIENQIKMLVEAKELRAKKEEVKLYDFGHDWILDNSTALGEEITITDYIELIKRFDPPIVVAPDVLNDKEKTLQRTEAFISRLELSYPKCPSRLMLVPQGATTTDFLECLFKILNFVPDILGIPYLYASPFFLRSREGPIEWALDRALLIKNNILPNINKGIELHLLGLWHPFELITGQLLGVRSNDSSLLFRCAATETSPFGCNRSISLDEFDLPLDLERFKQIYREFQNFISLIGGGTYAVLPNRFKQDDTNKGTTSARSSVGPTGGPSGEDPDSSSVECPGTLL